MKGGTKAGGEDRDQDVWELIPWYVNGTLDEADRRLVETTAEADPAVAAEIRQQRRIAETMADLDAMDEAEESSWSALSARIAAESAGKIHMPGAETELRPATEAPEADAPLPQTATVTRLDTERRKRSSNVIQAGPAPRELRLGRMPKLAVAAGIAVPTLLAAAIMAGIFLDPGERGGAGFETLTSGDSVAGTVIRLRTTDTLDRERMLAEIENLGLSIAEGPSENGVYTLSPGAGSDVAMAAETLGTLPGVAFVIVRERPE